MATWLETKTEEFLGDLIADVSEIRRDAISPEADFQEYGLDSRFVIAMNSRLEQYFAGLPRTVFFEYPSIRAVAAYLIDEFRAELESLFPDASSAPRARPPAEPRPEVSPAPIDLDSLARQIPLARTIASAPVAIPSAPEPFSNDVAVIGVAGRYPKARNIDEFWRNLREGRDCVEPLPKNRWRPAPSDPLRWGGYIDGVDEFDSLFFGISPREAETMDPQERLFLEVAWETIESAGYDPMRLAPRGEPASVGVFLGIMYADYHVFGAELTLLGQPTLMSESYATIPNRLSYFLNFSGPSLALDSMCSSSLTALHLACASLRSGDCKMALVAGVNLTIHPSKYRLLDAGKYLASDGRCRSYGADGDGYVPAEGIGALLVKPLADAQRDGDTIWGVVKSTSINHGGRARGYTTPNPSAQAASLGRALERARVEPHTLGYIEGHGTGTSLGDPIEIRGMEKTFGKLADKIPLGSVKSNLGHAEAAAGVAALTKVLLQLRARELAPSIHCEPPNPNIDFERAPVRVQRHGAPWERKMVESEGVVREIPRRALVSAFGAGGSNAHVIVEEAPPRPLARRISAENRLFVLSARSPERLHAQAERLLDFLARLPLLRELEATELLYDMCATLWFGRTAFDARLAIVADSLRTLQQKLGAFVYGASSEIPQSELAELAKRWLANESFDASAIFPEPWRKIALPSYAFERSRAWTIPGNMLYELPSAPQPKVASEVTAAKESAAIAFSPALQGRDPALVVEALVRDLVAEVLLVDGSRIRVDAPLFDYGLESVSAVELAERLNAMLGVDMTPTSFFEFNTLADFSRHLVSRYDLTAKLSGVPVDTRPSHGVESGPRPDLAPSRAPSIEALWEDAVQAEKRPEIELHVRNGVDGRVVEFATLGSGTPMLVFGGILSTHEALTLSPDISSLAESHRVIMVHPPGAGRSELPDGELTMAFIAEQIDVVRRSLGLSRVVLLGYSFGGLVAQWYATHFREHVSKIVLVCTTSEPASIASGMHLIAVEAKRHPDGMRALQFADLSKFPLYAQLGAGLRPEQFAYTDTPTLIVAGTEDGYVPPVHAEQLARSNPHATLRMVQGAGHFLGISHGAALVSLTRAFLREGEETPSAITLRAMSPESLGALKSYLENGEIGSGADISPIAGQVGYLLNRLLGGAEDRYNCFFAASGIEAVDTALRYGRRRAKLSKRSADAKTLIFDPSGSVQRHFEFLPGETLFPDLFFMDNPDELLGLVRSGCELASVYLAAKCEGLEAIVAECAERDIVSILAENGASESGALVSPALPAKPDVVVFDESMAGFQLPFGVCAIRRFQERGVFVRQPEEFALRLPGSMTGPVLTVVKEHLVRRFSALQTDSVVADLQAIVADPRETKEAHRQYVNPVLLESLDTFGLAERQSRGDRSGYALEREAGHSTRVINLYLVTSGSFRGHTGTEIAKSVISVHDAKQDYWAELERRIPISTGFERVLAAASPSTAVESALKLGLLAARKGSTLLVLEGSPVFTRLGALVSRVAVGSPLEALVESCGWSNVKYVDPFAPNAVAVLEAEFATGDVGFVWLETLQSDWGGLRSIPQPVLAAIDEHRSGYLVGVDETYTSVGCGRTFHWQGKLARPDIMALCMGWTDSQLIAGYVLTREDVVTRARACSEAGVAAIDASFRCQLTAHATLAWLDTLERDDVLRRIGETEKRFSAALNDLAAQSPLVRRVWGEGLCWAVQFDLEGWPRFVRDWFASFVWSECSRDPIAPVAVSMQPLTPACIRVEPRYDAPAAEIEAAVGTLKRVLAKGVAGIVSSVANDLEHRGDTRRAALFRRMLRGFDAAPHLEERL
ncbi:alpha/beta fold hydrolase [Pendulispora brunnea]|uniref:Alpha/beta fold hydrolase n=1 Tax=Pendulispora brunnea TaxID=2905690 RepID=A0ABZ2KNF0_9BACT